MEIVVEFDFEVKFCGFKLVFFLLLDGGFFEILLRVIGVINLNSLFIYFMCILVFFLK